MGNSPKIHQSENEKANRGTAYSELGLNTKNQTNGNITTWLSPKTIILSKRSKTQKNKCRTALMWSARMGKTKKSQQCLSRGKGRGSVWKRTLRELSEVMGMFYILIVLFICAYVYSYQTSSKCKFRIHAFCCV